MQSSRRIPPPLLLFLRITLLATLACVAIECFAGFVLHLGGPYNWPLTPYDEFALDLNSFIPKFQHFHDPSFFSYEPQYAFAYPAPMALLYWLVFRLPAGREIPYTIALGLTFIAIAAAIARAMVRRGLSPASASLFAGLLLVCAYPCYFLVKQGNLESVVWLILSAGLWLFLRGKGYSAAACFGLAGALKLFPIIFLGLHLARGRWRPALAGVLLAIGTTLGSLWLIAPDIAFTNRHIQAGLALFREKIVLQVVAREIGFDHSLFSIVKRAWFLAPHSMPLSTVLTIYMGVAALAGTLLYVFRIRRLPLVNQVFALTVAAILLPPVSYDYTLIHLYGPLTLLVLYVVSQAGEGAPSPSAVRPMLVLLALILAPFAEFIHHGLRYGGQLKALLLLALFVLVLIRPIPTSWDDRRIAD